MEQHASDGAVSKRGIVGMILQSIKDRGLSRMGADATDKLRAGLSMLDRDDIAPYYAAAVRLNRGSDEIEDFTRLRNLCRITQPSLITRFTQRGYLFSASEFEVALSREPALDNLLVGFVSAPEDAGLFDRVVAIVNPRLDATRPSGYGADIAVADVGAPARPDTIENPSSGMKNRVTTGSKAGGSPFPDSLRIFAKKGACVWNVGEGRANSQSHGKHVVLADFALCEEAGVQSYDWRNKIIFELGAGELAEVLCVLNRWIDVVEIKYHGTKKNKSLKFENQEGGLYLVCSSGKDGVSVSMPVEDGSRFLLSAMVLSCMVKNHPDLSDVALLTMAKNVWAAQI